MVITLTSKHDKPNTEDIARAVIGQKTYHSWPYLQEGLVTAVSDELQKFEIQQVGRQHKIIGTHHNPFQAIAWKKEADRVEHHQSKRFGILIGNVDVVLHVRPLKGLKRLDTGALVKDYEGADKELHQPWQTIVKQVAFEDERYIEKPAPPLEQEFPVGERIIFLGTQAYGTAGVVQQTAKDAMTVEVAYFPNENRENAEFARLVATRPSGHWHISPLLARRLGISALGLSRITSTLMVKLEDGSKANIGLSLKFESKGQKVLGWSKRNDRGWEFSETTARALEKYKAAFPEPFHRLDTRGGGKALLESSGPADERHGLLR